MRIFMNLTLIPDLIDEIPFIEYTCTWMFYRLCKDLTLGLTLPHISTRVS